MSTTPKRARRTPAENEVRELLQRLIDEVSGLRKEVAESKGLLVGTESAAGLLHEFRAFREAQSATNARLETEINARVKIDTVRDTATGARWVYVAIAAAVSLCGSVVGAIVALKSTTP